MKQLLLIFMTGIVSNIYSQTTFDEKYLSDGTYIFDDILRIEKEEIFTKYKGEFGLSDDDKMIEENTETLEDGKFHTKFVQLHHGYHVEGSMMNVLGDKNIVQRANGFILKGIKFDKGNIIAEDFALKVALSYVNAKKYA